MARLFWLVLIVAFVGALAMGASWAAAYSSVGTLLGAPPPRMGTQTTNFLWDHLPRLHQRPAVWRFAFSPTAIPGASSVRIYVGPWGRIVSTEPPDLAHLLVLFHRTPY
jgi:hypothetical protein